MAVRIGRLAFWVVAALWIIGCAVGLVVVYQSGITQVEHLKKEIEGVKSQIRQYDHVLGEVRRGPQMEAELARLQSATRQLQAVAFNPPAPAEAPIVASGRPANTPMVRQRVEPSLVSLLLLFAKAPAEIWPLHWECKSGEIKLEGEALVANRVSWLLKGLAALGLGEVRLTEQGQTQSGESTLTTFAIEMKGMRP